MDDWIRAVEELPGAAQAAVDTLGDSIAETFFSMPAALYMPLIKVS